MSISFYNSVKITIVIPGSHNAFLINLLAAFVSTLATKNKCKTQLLIWCYLPFKIIQHFILGIHSLVENMFSQWKFKC